MQRFLRLPAPTLSIAPFIDDHEFLDWRETRINASDIIANTKLLKMPFKFYGSYVQLSAQKRDEVLTVEAFKVFLKQLETVRLELSSMTVKQSLLLDEIAIKQSEINQITDKLRGVEKRCNKLEIDKK